MKKIGIIDVGSNSIRLVIFEISPTKHFKVIEDIKETVRLGEGFHNTGVLKIKKINLAINTLRLFKGICENYGVDEIITFATAAVRNAENSKEFLIPVKNQLSLDVAVLSGVDEARFSYLGAVNSLDVKEGLLMDMGGASTELVLFKGKKILESISLNFGSVTLSQISDVKNPLKKADESLLKEQIFSEYEKIEWLKNLEGIPLVGVGGTVRNLAKVHSTIRQYPLNLLHDYQMAATDVTLVYNFLKRKSYKEKLEVEGLAKSRADIFVGAACAVNCLLSHTGIQKLIISGSGIREGFLYSHLDQIGKEIENVYEYSLHSITENYNLSVETGDNTFTIFEKIFQELSPLHGIGDIDHKILKTACYFGRSGVNVNYYDYPLHSFYMILNSGLNGISHKKLLMAALIVSQQEKRNSLHLDYSDILNKSDVQLIDKLAVILKLSKIFNRVFVLEKLQFHVEIKDKDVIFHVDEMDVLDIQISKLLVSGRRFKEVFGKSIKVVKKQ